MSQFKDIITEKCPICGKGDVFEMKGNPLLFRMPRMRKACNVCGHQFEKEPGYFFGAMYVSYALTVAQMIAVFVLTLALIPDFRYIIGIVAVMSLALSTFNFRLSRMLWIYMFDGGKRKQLQSHN